ncbi:MAG: heavy-metal-associated domain-containing protein [Flavobacteriales bacterium]
MKYLIYFLLFGFCSVQAQFSNAKIGVNGLTCSACSRSVEIALKKLPFVDSVKMDLKKTEAFVFFKNGAKVEMYKVAKAVVDAGFSVRFLNANYQFSNTIISDNLCVNIDGNNYTFIKTNQRNLSGSVNLKFIGENYMSKTDLNAYKALMKSTCSTNSKNVKYYFVTF